MESNNPIANTKIRATPNDKNKKKNCQLSVPITTIFNVHWMRQKPFGDNKHTAFNYVIGRNLVKREWKDLEKSLQ